MTDREMSALVVSRVQDGLDMVLSMSSRLPELWQSLILSSQFEKSENKRQKVIWMVGERERKKRELRKKN